MNEATTKTAVRGWPRPLEGAFSGHSPRVGMAVDLVSAGASVAAVHRSRAGGCRPRMPATYARSVTAGRREPCRENVRSTRRAG